MIGLDGHIMLKYIHRVLDKLDIIIAIAGVLLGLLITLLYLISPTIQLLTLGIALFFASLTYLLIQRVGIKSPGLSELKSIKNLYDIGFLIAFSLSLLVLHSSTHRPLLYFVLIALCAGLLALSIVSVDTKKGTIIQIFKIFLISFNLKLSIHYFYGGMGVDYWGHMNMNRLLSQIGDISVLSGKETYYPLMHIQAAVSQMVLDVPIRDATGFGITIPLVISSICVYLVGAQLFNEKIGLFAMLIIGVSDFHIYWAASPQTTSFGLCLYFFLILFIFKMLSNSMQKGWFQWTLLTLLFVFTIILTHAVSSFIALITVCGLFLGLWGYTQIFEKDNNVSLGIVPIFFIIGLIQHWFVAVYSDMTERSFFDVIISTLYHYLDEYAGFLDRPEAAETVADTGEAIRVLAQPPLIELIANQIGLTILMFFSIIGCLFWLSISQRDHIKFTIIFTTLILLGITFIFPLFGIRNILPYRWFGFFYFFLAIMAAFAIMELIQRLDKIKLYEIGIFITIVSLTFFMSMNTYANQDSPIWLKESTVPAVYTIAELKGGQTLNQFTSTIITDSRYGGSCSSYLGIQRKSFRTERDIFNMINQKDSVFLWRERYFDQPVSIHTRVEEYNRRISKPTVLGTETFQKLEDINKIYDIGDIYGYVGSEFAKI